MLDLDHFKTLIDARIGELSARIKAIEEDLDQPKTKDLIDQAIDLEDDEALETIGHAAQREVALLRKALGLIEKGEYGICQNCGAPILKERMEAVLYAVLCRTCAGAKPQ
ncbi:MAG: TraR/DksA family transcriptional regulator [Pseudomonadota bacterium]